MYAPFFLSWKSKFMLNFLSLLFSTIMFRFIIGNADKNLKFLLGDLVHSRDPNDKMD